MSQRIAAAILFVLALCAAPPDAGAPRPRPRIAWDLFATERLLAGSDARGLFGPGSELASLTPSPLPVRATPEPGTSALVALGLALLARRRALNEATRARRATLWRRPAASGPPGRRGR